MEQTKLLDYTKRINDSIGAFRAFDIYDRDDIGQEIYFLILEAEPIFDESKGDEFTFYYNYSSNRLKNFKRDKYANNQYKRNIMDALTMEGDTIIGDEQDIFMEIAGEYTSEIDCRVLSHFRADYLRFKEGAKISYRNKALVIEHVNDIIKRINKERSLVNGS